MDSETSLNCQSEHNALISSNLFVFSSFFLRSFRGRLTHFQFGSKDALSTALYSWITEPLLKNCDHFSMEMIVKESYDSDHVSNSDCRTQVIIERYFCINNSVLKLIRTSNRFLKVWSVAQRYDHSLSFEKSIIDIVSDFKKES